MLDCVDEFSLELQFRKYEVKIFLGLFILCNYQFDCKYKNVIFVYQLVVLIL